jgi:hypothetical protein
MAEQWTESQGKVELTKRQQCMRWRFRSLRSRWRIPVVELTNDSGEECRRSQRASHGGENVGEGESGEGG